VTWWSRWRSDLARPERPIDRKEVPLLAASAVLIVLIAQATDPGTAVELLVVAIAAVTLVLRGVVTWLPWEAVAVVVSLALGVTISQEGVLEVAFFLCVFVTLYAAWHLGSTTRALLVAAVSAASPLVVSLAIPEEEIAWTPWVAANGLTFVLGRNLRRQRTLIEQLEAAREALAEKAVSEERRRIARELHDLTGHTIAAVLLHVTGARHVLRRDLDETERALVQAETIGRSSLDQIRATVASLRTSERGTDPALPGTADLIGLVEEYRRAGLDVTAVIAPPVAGIEGPIGTALHRISREALANVARHAPSNRVELTVTLDPPTDVVRLVVADHGHAAAVPVRDDGHFGLVGMRERARALGGELDAGPTNDGWRVEARLPLATADEERAVP
jgi:signal transduction histidine kinase